MGRLYAGIVALIVAATIAFWFLFGTQGARQRDPALDAAPAEPVATAPAEAAVAPPAAPAARPRQTVERKVVESGIPIRLVRRVRIAAPTGPLVARWRQLDEEARSGNSVSKYELGLVLYECRDTPADPVALEREVESIHQTRRHGGWDVDKPAAEVRELRERYANCDGIPAEARGQFRDWLKQAADAGVIEALVNLPLKLPSAEYCQFLAECPPAQRAAQEALQKEAIDYVNRAREAGSVSALWTLGAWYAEGEVVPKNEIEAYAHFRALDQINASSGQGQRFGRMLAGLRKQLRPIDLDAAEARSRELLSNPNCCVITP